MIKHLVRKITPSFILDYYHYFLAFLGALLYRFPSRKLIVIGVTGTKGKSTVVELTSKILEEAGRKAASVSSIKFKINGKEWRNDLKMTMPGRLRLQKFLRQAVNEGCRYAIIEVTSEGMKQNRHRFIDFSVAVLTNLAPEHIESHGSFEKYREAKGRLFASLKIKNQSRLGGTKIKNTIKNSKTRKISIINLDDENAKYFLQFPADEKITYGLNRGDINIENTKFTLRLIGEFNIYNALAAIAVGISQEIDLATCKRAIEKVDGIPGRMEAVVKEPFTVIVDYAHTPDSLVKVYQTLTHQLINSSTNQLICVLGAAGGGRDKWKRPEMGKIAAEYCNEIILTNEDPYDENPMEIINQVASGAENISANQRESAVFKILDRREAIKKALSLAKLGDLVAITGKGSEPWMCVARGKKIPWDDREIIKEEIKGVSAHDN